MVQRPQPTLTCPYTNIHSLRTPQHITQQPQPFVIMALLALPTCYTLFLLAAVCVPAIVAEDLDDYDPVHNDFFMHTLVPATLLAFVSFYVLLRICYIRWRLPNYIGIPLIWLMYGPIIFYSSISDDDWDSKFTGIGLAGSTASFSVIAWDMLHNPLNYRRIPEGDVPHPAFNDYEGNNVS